MHAAELQEPQAQYREQVETVWEDRPLGWDDIGWLWVLASELGLTQDESAAIEREVMGDVKEAIHYREAVESTWADQKLDEAEVGRLQALEAKLDLSKDVAANIEQQVMAGTKEAILERDHTACQTYRQAVEAVWQHRPVDGEVVRHLLTRARDLGLSRDMAAEIEAQVMGDSKERIFDRQRELERAQEDARRQYRNATREAWADKTLDATKVASLFSLARRLQLSDQDIVRIEIEVMGDCKERIQSQQRERARQESLRAVEATKQQERELAELYDSGVRYLNAGHNLEAVSAFEELQRRQPNYRDTAALLERARTPIQPAPSPAPERSHPWRPLVALILAVLAAGCVIQGVFHLAAAMSLWTGNYQLILSLIDISAVPWISDHWPIEGILNAQHITPWDGIHPRDYFIWWNLAYAGGDALIVWTCARKSYDLVRD